VRMKPHAGVPPFSPTLTLSGHGRREGGGYLSRTFCGVFHLRESLLSEQMAFRHRRRGEADVLRPRARKSCRTQSHHEIGR